MLVKAHGMLKKVGGRLVGRYVNAYVANDSTNAENFIATTWCPWTSASVYTVNEQGDGLSRKRGSCNVQLSLVTYLLIADFRRQRCVTYNSILANCASQHILLV